MKVRRFVLAAAAVFAVASVAFTSAACNRCCPRAPGAAFVVAGPPQPQPAQPAQPGQPSQPAAEPDQAAIMAELMKLATPGEQHARLKYFEGEWTVHFKSWMGETPTESTGTSSAKLILGGRYLTEEVHGDFAGMPFEGRAITGYDNYKKQWFSVWLDNFGTGFMNSTGTETEAGKAWEYRSSMDSPWGHEDMRMVLRVVSDKEYTFEMLSTSPQKPGEHKTMEIRYTRK